MSHYLPTGKILEIQFKKKNEGNSSTSVLRNPDNNKCGYLLEWDLKIPFNIHEKAKLFPFFDIKQ